VTSDEVEDLLAMDRGVEREVEALERLLGIERRTPQLELFLGMAFDIVLDQPLQELDVGQLLLDRLTVTDVGRFDGPPTSQGVREMTKVKSLHTRWSEDTNYKAEYEALEGGFELARTLIEARTRAGLSQTQLARRMKTSQLPALWQPGGTLRLCRVLEGRGRREPRRRAPGASAYPSSSSAMASASSISPILDGGRLPTKSLSMLLVKLTSSSQCTLLSCFSPCSVPTATCVDNPAWEEKIGAQTTVANRESIRTWRLTTRNTR